VALAAEATSWSGAIKTVDTKTDRFTIIPDRVAYTMDWSPTTTWSKGTLIGRKVQASTKTLRTPIGTKIYAASLTFCVFR
jgi:hypothetical protein